MSERTLQLAHDFGFVMLSDEELELRMYGRIGNGFFEEGITAKLIGDTLAKAPRAKKLKVKLSSPGGSVDDGMAIRSMLSAHPATVVMDIEGLAASAGSVIAMSGDTIRMHDGASLMIHEGRAGAFGTIAELGQKIDALKTINDGAATIYAARTGKTKEEILRLMAAETWLTPQQAKDQGFVDEVVPAKKGTTKTTMYFDLAPYGYQNVPPEVAARSRVAAIVGGGSKQQETEDMANFARIALALGLAETAEEQAVMIALDKRTATDKQVRAQLEQFTTLSGESDPAAALGVLQAWKQSHELVPKLQKTIEENASAMEVQERTSLYANDANDPKGRKLTPATKEFWDKQPVASLKAYLEKAPYVVPAPERKQPPAAKPPADGDNAPPTKQPEADLASLWAKPFSELKPIEMHRLKRADPDRYAEMREAALS